MGAFLEDPTRQAGEELHEREVAAAGHDPTHQLEDDGLDGGTVRGLLLHHLLRMCTRMSEIGILTGHTSLQAPQRLEAYGSDLSTFDATPRSCGVRMAPIGPG